VASKAHVASTVRVASQYPPPNIKEEERLIFTCDSKVTRVSSRNSAGSAPAGAIGSAEASHSQDREVRAVRLVRGRSEPKVRLFLVV
jgi:hypothetical protein